jgi:hypothetical protein
MQSAEKLVNALLRRSINVILSDPSPDFLPTV